MSTKNHFDENIHVYLRTNRFHHRRYLTTFQGVVKYLIVELIHVCYHIFSRKWNKTRNHHTSFDNLYAHNFSSVTEMLSCLFKAVTTQSLPLPTAILSPC